MMRIVAFRKAAFAGLAGAAAMEVYGFVGSRLGFASVDFIDQLSSVDFGGMPLVGETIGTAAHLGIGVGWAIFYAFFLWGRWHLPPVLQGLIFSVVPASLAILIITPELALMRLRADIVTLDLQSYLAPLSTSVVVSLVIAHAIFGLII